MSDDFAPPADIACTVPDEYGAHCPHWAYRTASCCMCGAGIWEEDSDDPECPALRAVQVTTPAPERQCFHQGSDGPCELCPGYGNWPVEVTTPAEPPAEPPSDPTRPSWFKPGPAGTTDRFA